MKKITTLMVMLMGCVFSALAQTVASTATALESLQSGYYVVLMKTADDRTDQTNGNFVYYGENDLAVCYDEASASDNNLRSTTLSQDNFKYVFYVENNGGKISLKAYGTNYYWPAIPAAEKNDSKCNPANQLNFTVGTSAASYSYSANGGWYYLTSPATKWEKTLGIWHRRATDITALVNVNSDAHKIGYWEGGDKNRCQFQFYAVDDMPEPGQVATITYNYTFGGQVRKTQSFGAERIGRAYPDVDLTGLPDFITAEKPVGTVSGDETVEIPLTENLPFQTSTDAAPIYYYLENVQGEGTRLYSSNGLAYRASAQSETVNGVRDDLWYVTGNPFDGFKFYSVGESHELQSSAVVSLYSVISSHLAFSGAPTNTTNTWDLIKAQNGFGICIHVGSDYATSVWPPFPKATKENQKGYSWNYANNLIDFKAYEAGNAAFSFRLVPATFTFPMYPGGDDNTYNTFAAPFAVALADDENAVKMYKGTVNTAEKELELSEVNAVPANAGVMLMAEGSQAQNVTFKVIADAPALESNDLVGTTVELAAADLADKLILGISDETQKVGFFSINGNVATLTANHAYLNKTNSAVQTLSVRLAGQPTSIGQISVDTNKVNTQTPVYDLTGRRVNSTVKGQLYIQNGRKFIAQ